MVITPFTPVFSTNDTGSITLIGNTLETASTVNNPGRTQQQVINAQNQMGFVNDNDWFMSYVDVDNNPTTFNSSTAGLTLPAGSTVLFAGLYWGSATTTPAQAALRTQVLFSTPTSNGAYTTINGSLIGSNNFTGVPSGSIYEGFADVTALVQAAGNGTYGIANVQGTLQVGSYTGWGLIVVARVPGAPARNLTVLNGYAVQGASDPPLNVPVSGFITPPSGPVNSRVGIIAYEGDLGTTGDSLALNGVRLSDALKPVNNFFNSTITNEGQFLTNKNPNFRNQFGFGIQKVTVPQGVIPNGATSATITLSTSGDGYFPGAITFETDLFSPDIRQTKSFTDLNGGRVAPGDIIEYSITVTNSGQDASNNTVLTDFIPANTTYVPGSLQIVSGSNAGAKTDAVGDDQADFLGDRVVFRLGVGANGTMGGTKLIGASATLRFRVRVNDLTPNLTVVDNQASVTYTGATTGFGLTSTSNVSSFTVQAQADLSIVKAVSPANPQVGQVVTFVITVRNLGPDTASNVVVTDLLPSGLTFVRAAATQGTYDAVTGLWNVGTLTGTSGAGGRATLLIQAIQTSTTPSVNTATITNSSVPDPNPNNNTATAVVDPPEADLALTKTIDNPNPNVGSNVTFTLTLTNNGSNTATSTQVSDPLPEGLTFLSATPSLGSYNAATGIWSVGSLAVGQTVTLTIVARVDDTMPAVNSAVASAAQDDTNPENNSASVSETPQIADLQISKTVDNPTPDVGDTITFTITIGNLGLNTATNIVVTDVLPPGVTFQSATPSQGTYDPVTGLWSVGTLIVDDNDDIDDPGDTATLTIVVTVDDNDQISNTATVTDLDQFDPNLENNTSTALVTPLSADLNLLKAVDNATPNVGDIITYTLTLTNEGPSATTGVQVTDLIPAGITFLSATPSQGTYDPSTGLWLVGSMVGGAQVTLVITARVDAPFVTTNAAVASSDEFDPDPPDNTGMVTVTPQQADLSVAKSVSNATPNVGDTVTYTIQVANNGANDATGVLLTDILPDGYAFVGATPSQGAYDPGTGLWTIGNLANGATATLTIQVSVLDVFAAPNFASVTADQFDPNLNNNLDDVLVTPQVANLGVTKTVSNATPPLNSSVTYTITLRNSGPTAATGVTVADPLPAGLSFVSATPSQGSFDPATGLWTVGTLANGAVATLVITVTVTGTGPQTNTATAASNTPDPNPNNNQSSVTVTPTPPEADLVVGKTVDRPAPALGDTVTFTVRVTNNGPGAAPGVVLSDPLPPGLMFVSATATQGSYDSATGLWMVGTLLNGVTAILQVMGRIVGSGTLVNMVTGSHLEDDPVLSNNTAVVTLLVPEDVSKRQLLGSTPVGLNDVLPLGTVPLPPPDADSQALIAVGAGAGNVPLVRVFDRQSGQLRFSFYAYDSSFRGGVNVALGDVNGDGVPDIITAPGPGGGPNVRVFDGATGALVRSFFAYEPSFTGGVNVAAGDVNGDGLADIVAGSGPGGGPVVMVFNGQTGTLIRGFFAYEPEVRNGVNVAAGDVNGDGLADIVTAPGFGGGPRVRAFSSPTGAVVTDFFAYDPSFRGGVNVAVGDVDGDGIGDIITGAGQGGGPQIREFSSLTGQALRSFLSMDPGFRGGVWVAATDADGDGLADVVAAAGPGGGPRVSVLDGLTGATEDDFFAFNPGFFGGVSVAAAPRV